MIVRYGIQTKYLNNLKNFFQFQSLRSSQDQSVRSIILFSSTSQYINQVFDIAEGYW
jgi:hypothetical protein